VTVAGSAPKLSTESADKLDVVALDRQMMDNLPVFDQNYVGTHGAVWWTAELSERGRKWSALNQTRISSQSACFAEKR